MQPRKLQLIWNIDKFRCYVGDIEIAVAPEKFAPFSVNAVVEAQDTSLILSKTDEIRDPGDEPIWYFAGKMEVNTHLLPGQVIVRDTRPIRLQAIIYDIEQDPISRVEWIKCALENILEATEIHGIESLQMPLLGIRYGNLTELQSAALLIICLKRHAGKLKQLWIVSHQNQCQREFEAIDQSICQSHI